jgi:DNA-binding transcriptional LysR family regulator
MHALHLASTDLNLLVVLDALLEERSVTRAAKRLGRTQPATSHALARLRALFEDPLLVRVGGAMRPTPRAAALASEVARALAAVRRVLAAESEFDPTQSDRVFTLSGPDFVAAAFPALLGDLANAGSTASVEVIAAAPGMLRDVAEGRVDAAVALAPSGRVEGLRSELLVALDWAVYARGDHPAVRAWSAKAWASYPHLRIRTPSREPGPVELAARAAKLRRRSGPVLPHFLLAPPLLARTDMLLTVPRAILSDVAPRFGLAALPCPLKLAPIELWLHWSATLEGDAAGAWFRARVREAVSSALGMSRRSATAGRVARSRGRSRP